MNMAERSRRQLKKNQDLERILCLEKERARLRTVLFCLITFVYLMFEVLQLYITKLKNYFS